ncbi:MAG: hypothetical protein SOX74_04855 [Candidatus Faecousia sp.]|uniref:hypothetical protein n=1 Tax=Faecousia sp. TaxID=2952921 RepID=UPI002A8B866D|nr:hypothetical protein [Candidatus Faecousia sp.]
MERLTYFKNGEWRMDFNGCQYQANFVDRLAAYEETGLTPEQCAEYAKADREGRYIVLRDAEQDGVKRIRELAEADKDGRLVVLPCKSGDTVYEVTSRKTISEYRVKAIRVELFWTFIEWDIVAGFVDKSNFGVPVNEIGKSVFLTREEAERALQEMEGKA